MTIRFAINHMTAPSMDYRQLLDLAQALGASGVEFRNDFSHRELFEGDDPKEVKSAAIAAGIPILALSEVKMFNRWSDEKAQEAEDLMKIAVAAGIPAVSLIPANDGQGLGNGARQANLRLALRELKPMLESYDLIGNVEPLGFATSTVRHKPDTIDAIEAVGGKERFRLVHDSFHHALSGDENLYPEYTGIVHISAVANQSPAIEDLLDGDRVLVDGKDRLGNIDQILGFEAAGWGGVYSFEPFSKDIHELDNPEDALRTSMNFIIEAVRSHAA